MKMLMLIADGFEEIEAVAPIDLLRRGGVSITVCSITGRKLLTGTHEIQFQAEELLPDRIAENDAAQLASAYDGVILPGGQPNASTLRGDSRVIAIVKAFYAAGKITAAICAAPCVFEKAGILQGKRATSFPGCIDPSSCASYEEERAVRDGTVITSRSAGTAIDFAIEILRGLGLSDSADAVRSAILY